VPAIGWDDIPINLGGIVNNSFYRGNVGVRAIADHCAPSQCVAFIGVAQLRLGPWAIQGFFCKGREPITGF